MPLEFYELPCPLGRARFEALLLVFSCIDANTPAKANDMQTALNANLVLIVVQN